MKVVFLDIDGVLNVYCRNRDEFGCCFHKHFESNLQMIIEKTNAKIVISSTWRMSGLSIMQKMWMQRKLAGEIIGITPCCSEINDVEFYDKVERGHEIQQWLNNNIVENYCIIDDDNDMLESQKNNFVRTANNFNHKGNIEGYGLTEKCAEMVIRVLNCT